MTERTMKAILDFAQCHGFEMQGHDDYSGRGMFGRTTCAVSYAHPRELLICVARAAYDHGITEEEQAQVELMRDLAKLCFDELGRDMIAY